MADGRKQREIYIWVSRLAARAQRHLRIAGESRADFSYLQPLTARAAAPSDTGSKLGLPSSTGSLSMVGMNSTASIPSQLWVQKSKPKLTNLAHAEVSLDSD